ncbi:AI-2E family transporter [Oceanicoccus sp. KOV_DT_Chl]|uniref:AI-2E family transporter n=1 Tax=Oceanicoccus sp. KOV_DT_Chl TaxID=1904639 RepID=UPI00135AAA0C|nr:AI-2E family transporter [Oceanicoccus sp. KOV_DT_Chl]
MTDHLGDLQNLLSGNIKIRPPKPEVAEWPVIGQQVFQQWSEVSANTAEYLKNHRESVIAASKTILGLAGTATVDVLIFVAAFIITGVMLAYTQEADVTFERIFIRFTTAEKGPRLRKLSIATIRSVAVGVIGVAFIQALILGVGLLLADIPAAGLLALLIFFIGILQLPALIVTIPAVMYLWSMDFSTTHNTIFTVWLIVGGFSDQILKPLLLGRGVDAPMVIILIGALGGMISGGLIGLFVGGVTLALGYKIFMEWVNEPDGVAGLIDDVNVETGSENS